MEFVSEEIIDRVAENLGASDSSFEQAIEHLQYAQPALLAFFLSENFEVFTREERDYLLFLMLVIWQAVESVKPDLPQISEQDLSEAEERNWEMLQQVKSRRFRERLDVFFDGHPQEDLLAFIEDAVMEEDEMITSEGREPMFVSLKSVVDCLTSDPVPG